MRDLLQFSLLSLSAVFVIVDPVGVVPLFLALTPTDTTERRRRMALRACVIAWCVLVAFAWLGAQLLHMFGVTLAAFKVAGGLLLLLTAVDQLRGQPSPTRATAQEQEEGAAKEDVSVVPLAIPLLAGPGSVAVVMMLMSRADSLVQSAVVVAAITFTLGVAWLMLLSSERIARLLGTTGRLVAERVIGLVMAAMAVQFILDGVVEGLAPTLATLKAVGP
jgi:multiple antibiotic resistance protein